jgi:DNA-binding transcriptional LysR family regulator
MEGTTMNFQQLRYVREAVRQNLNLTEAAARLFTSQPGVSKQIRDLENEIGVEIFVRKGKRLVAITEPGKEVVAAAEKVLQAADNLRRVGAEYQDQDSGSLTIATTHTQARYALPTVVRAFKRKYPKVKLTLQQGNPPQLAQMVLAGEADVAIATEALASYSSLVAMPGYTWHHCIVVPAGHPLLKLRRVTLADLAVHPIITYDPAFTGRSHIDQAFAERDIEINLVLTAIDTDVIKTYVELGMGVGIIAAMAFNARRDSHLRAIDAGHLFRSSVTRVAVRKGDYLRRYTYDFIEIFAPHLHRKAVNKAMADQAN